MQPLRILQTASFLALAAAASRNGTTTSKDGLFPATCRSGSVNYITASLPEQCATSIRSAATASTPTTAADQSSTVLTGETRVTSDQPATTVLQHIVVSGNRSTTSQVQTDSTVSNTATTNSASSIPAQDSQEDSSENDADSPLDNANFLSFEEWKKKNLVKAGQNPEHVGQQRTTEGMPRRTRPGNSNDFDVLGEDSEIELDFTGFGAQGPPRVVKTEEDQEREQGTKDKPQSGKPISQQTLRSKDAGRTCKERTNYASFDCAATVLKTNPECKSASSLLVENKDSYMLNICKVQNKFFIVELCNDILIDTVVLANYEFFSSIFRTFRLSVSDRYPVKADKWRELGVYEARNTREVQAFLVEEPLIWARYLRVEILSHYGNEYYCPVSLLRVHGTTMMEEFRHQEDLARGDYAEEIATEESQALPEEMPVKQESPQESVGADKSASDFVSIAPKSASDSSSRIATSTQSATGGQISESTTVMNNNGANGTHQVTATTPDTSSHPRESTSTATTGQPNRTETLKQSDANKTGDDSGAAITPTAPVNMSSALIGRDDASHASSPITSINGSIATLPVNTTLPSTATSVSTSASSTESPKRPSPIVLHAPSPSTQESFFKSIHKRLQMLESNATLSLQYIEESSRMLRDAFGKVEKRQVRKTETFLSTLNATVRAELQSFRSQYDLLWQSTVIELETQRRQYQSEMQSMTGRLDVLTSELLYQKRMVVLQTTLLMLCLIFVLFSRTGSGVEVGLLAQLAKSPMLRGTGAVSKMYSPPLSPDARREESPSWRRRFWRRSMSPGLAGEYGTNGVGVGVRFQSPTPRDSSAEEDEEQQHLSNASADGASGTDDEADDGQQSEDESPTRRSPDIVQAGEFQDAPVESVELERDDSELAQVAPLRTRSSPSTPLGTRDGPGLMLGLDGAMGSSFEGVDARPAAGGE